MTAQTGWNLLIFPIHFLQYSTTVWVPCVVLLTIFINKIIIILVVGICLSVLPVWSLNSFLLILLEVEYLKQIAPELLFFFLGWDGSCCVTSVLYFVVNDFTIRKGEAIVYFLLEKNEHCYTSKPSDSEGKFCNIT